jgi:hypothetical protein
MAYKIGMPVDPLVGIDPPAMYNWATLVKTTANGAIDMPVGENIHCIRKYKWVISRPKLGNQQHATVHLLIIGVPVKNYLDMLHPLGYTKTGTFKCLYIQVSKNHRNRY